MNKYLACFVSLVMCFIMACASRTGVDNTLDTNARPLPTPIPGSGVNVSLLTLVPTFTPGPPAAPVATETPPFMDPTFRHGDRMMAVAVVTQAPSYTAIAGAVASSSGVNANWGRLMTNDINITTELGRLDYWAEPTATNDQLYANGCDLYDRLWISDTVGGSSLILDMYATVAAQGHDVLIRRSKGGTVTSPTPVGEDDQIAHIKFQGRSISDWKTCAYIEVIIEGTVTPTSLPGSMNFFTSNEAGASTKILSLKYDKSIEMPEDYVYIGDEMLHLGDATGSTGLEFPTDGVMQLGAGTLDFVEYQNDGGQAKYIVNNDGNDIDWMVNAATTGTPTPVIHIDALTRDMTYNGGIFNVEAGSLKVGGTPVHIGSEEIIFSNDSSVEVIDAAPTASRVEVTIDGTLTALFDQPGDFWIEGTGIHLNMTGADADQWIKFWETTEGTEYLGWENGVGEFYASDEFHASGALLTDNNLYMGQDGEGSSFLYAYENGGATGAYLKFDDGDDRWEFNHGLEIEGLLTLNGVDPHVTPTPLYFGTATPVSGSGQRRWNTDCNIPEVYNGTSWMPERFFAIEWGWTNVAGDLDLAESSYANMNQSNHTLDTGSYAIYAVWCQFSAAPGAGDSTDVSVQIEGVDTEVEATVSDSEVTGFDLVAANCNVIIDPGEDLAVQITRNGTPSSTHIKGTVIVIPLDW